ncbi:WD40/YVTN/BNR-like repeat-containing protein [Dyella japonica]|uniref:Photosynthesis system II assembly factor Ycf48/Hcf136-like domain-containing protein n=1 Tax=Dyella japonica A8 TaxID=1217721 RepID=A0A075K437_9GAMM|nr:hypothetical protein [Dyella japonica]AIF48850.1 hypothetical protein HY57_17185 [Dyella japonica A8]
MPNDMRLSRLPASIRKTLSLMTWALVCSQGMAFASDAPLTPQAGSHWQKLPTEPYKGKQDDIYVVNRDVAFYVNGKGNIWRSMDGGHSWQNVLKQPGTYFRSIGMVDARHGYAGNIGTGYYPGVTDSTPLYETTDGGDHWQTVTRVPGPAMQGVCGIDILHPDGAAHDSAATVIHAAGRVNGPARLLNSLDGGKTWTNTDMTPWIAMIVDVKFFDAMNGVIYGGSDADLSKSHAVIITTHDGGAHWTRAYESKRPSELIWKGSFPTRRVGYATIQSYDTDARSTQRWVAKTTDGGKTWSELPLVDDKEVNEFGVGFANADLGWVGTTKGGFETKDGGKHWEHVEMGRVVNKIRVLPDGQHFTAYAIGSDVYEYTSEALPAASSSTATVKVDKP